MMACCTEACKERRRPYTRLTFEGYPSIANLYSITHRRFSHISSLLDLVQEELVEEDWVCTRQNVHTQYNTSPHR